MASEDKKVSQEVLLSTAIIKELNQVFLNVQIFCLAFSCFECYEMIILFLKKYQAMNYFLLETINQLTKPLHFKCYHWHPIRKVHYSWGKARDEVSFTIYNISC